MVNYYESSTGKSTVPFFYGIKRIFSFFYRGMLSHAVHPPTTEHVYAQWQVREELPSRAPLGLLQEDNGQNLDVKEEEVASPTSGEPTSRNHFKTSRAVRLKFKGTRKNAKKLATCNWLNCFH